MKSTCTRRIQFCAGHRVMGHEGKCRFLHGHNYTAHVTAAAELDSIGRVIDFSVLKDRVGGWIEQWWDHGFLLCVRDSEAIAAVTALAGQKVYLMDDNPTAENMAAFLLLKAQELMGEDSHVKIERVRVDETPNCYSAACYG